MKNPNERTCGYIEGYAAALWDIIANHPGFDGGCKSYDPAQVWEGKVHSYVFDLKDGGRHHPLSDYKDLEELLRCFLAEALNELPIGGTFNHENVTKLKMPLSLEDEIEL